MSKFYIQRVSNQNFRYHWEVRSVKTNKCFGIRNTVTKARELYFTLEDHYRNDDDV